MLKEQTLDAKAIIAAYPKRMEP